MSQAFIPRPHQPHMINHLIDHRRCALWAEPGLGKTSAVLSALDALWIAGSNCWPALVIAPKRVATDVWAQEAAKWDEFSYMQVSVLVGTPKQREQALRACADVYVINFENTQWLTKQLNGAWPFKTVVVDEATKLKGFRHRGGSKRARALAKISGKAGRWIELTGTPAANGMKDLYGQVFFLDHGERLGRTWTDFKRRYFDENLYTFQLTEKPGAREQITDKVKDLCLTVRAEDWFDLRKPVITTVPVILPPKAMKLYKDYEKNMWLQLDSEEELLPANAAHYSSQCLQIASGGVITEEGYEAIHDAKLDALESIVSETNGANLLVGYWWRNDLTRLQQRFPKARALHDSQDIEDWNNGDIPMLLCHYASAGHGLSLQHGGHRIVHYSRGWGLETDEQLRARCGPVRQMQAGYERVVYEYNLVATGTIDEELLERHRTKRAVQDILLNSTKRKV